MNLQTSPICAQAEKKLDPSQAAQALVRLLGQTPEYEAFLKALEAVNSDLTVQRLGAQMHAHQNSLQRTHDGDGQHAVELARLERELEDLPILQEYRKAEAQVRRMFCAADEIIGQEAGVTFAENARRSGCCG